MKTSSILLIGFVLGITVTRWGILAAWILNRIPPGTPAGHQPRFRTWHGGKETTL